MVVHRHILLNGEVVSRPSYQLKSGDKISIREKARGNLRIQNAIGLHKDKAPISWLDTHVETFSGTFLETPVVSELPAIFKIKLVVELYSK